MMGRKNTEVIATPTDYIIGYAMQSPQLCGCWSLTLRDLMKVNNGHFYNHYAKCEHPSEDVIYLNQL